MVLWYKLGIRPAWNEAVPGRTWPQLTWQAKRDQTDASDVADILTRSPARIPGANYEPHGASAGLLVLNDAAVLLESSPFS